MAENQEVRYLLLEDLILWTENPRDPIDPESSNQRVIDRAVEDRKLKWNLRKLASEMGDVYDFSELPTVVMMKGKPVVYDGNRRVALGLIKMGFITPSTAITVEGPNFPSRIPCNVCTQETALKNVLRKHGDSGSWGPLERDMFLCKYMNAEKSAFIVIDEATGLISGRDHLNQRFVKEEVFKKDILAQLGMVVEGNELKSKHSEEETLKIFDDISNNIEQKHLSTRKKRGQVLDVLDIKTRNILEKNKSQIAKPIVLTATETPSATTRLTKRQASVRFELFGRKLVLQPGSVNNLYRDIKELHEIYSNDKSKFSKNFISLIRMSLRLIVELAGTEYAASSKKPGKPIDLYISSFFSPAKSKLDQNAKTFLSSQNVTSTSILQLLNTGAHSYISSSNEDQALAMSIIIGEMLILSHGK